MSEQLLSEIRDLLLLLVKSDAFSKGYEFLTEEEFVREQIAHITASGRPATPEASEDRLREQYRHDGGYRRCSRPGLAR